MAMTYKEALDWLNANAVKVNWMNQNNNSYKISPSYAPDEYGYFRDSEGQYILDESAQAAAKAKYAPMKKQLDEAMSVIYSGDQSARAQARQNSPSWQQAVAEYNSTGSSSSYPEFNTLFKQLNNYYTDGAAAPGNLSPVTAAQALGQWEVDSQDSGFDKLMFKVAPLAAIAAGGYGLAGNIGWLGGGAQGAGATGAAESGMSAASLAGSDPYLASVLNSGITPEIAAAAQAGATTAPGLMSSFSGVPDISSLYDLGNVAAGASGLSTAANLASKIPSGSSGASSGLQSVLGKAGITNPDGSMNWGNVASAGADLAPYALGYMGAQSAAESQDKVLQQQKDLAAKYEAMGEPYRQKLSDLYGNPDAFLNSQEVQKPVQQASDIMARSLSTQGNPTGSGRAMQQLQSYSADQLYGRLGEEKNRLAGFGGLTQYQGAAPGIASSANVQNPYDIQKWQAAGAGAGALNDIFNPKPASGWDEYWRKQIGA